MTMLDRFGDGLRTTGAALAEALNGTVMSAIRWRKGLTSPDGPTISRVAGSPGRRVAGSPGRRVAGSPGRRVAGSPGRRVAGSPGRRVAGSPGRRVAGSPGRRVAGSPGRRVAGSPGRRVAGSPYLCARSVMSAPASRDRSRPPTSPPEPSASGRRSETSRPASSPDSLGSTAARTVAGVRLAARCLRHGLAAALLSLPLLAVLPTGAQAQTVECTTANTDGSYDVPFGWALKPSGLAAGTKFRLLFITSTSRDGTATDIATYNTFVQTAAKAGHSAISDSCGNKFKVVGSTSSVDARVNTDSESTDTGALIYWLNGDKAADNYGDFYDGGWDSTSATDESGSFNNGINVWTGSNSDGTKSSYYLGRATPPLVRHGSRTGTPLSHGNNSRTSISPFYALSPVFTVGAVPDPLHHRPWGRSRGQLGHA